MRKEKNFFGVNMFVYKNYTRREDIEQDYKNEKLKHGYIFAYDKRLYVIDNKSNYYFYKPLHVHSFHSKAEKEHLDKLFNLIWYEYDIIYYEDIKRMVICNSLDY
jgi:hypothetical protein